MDAARGEEGTAGIWDAEEDLRHFVAPGVVASMVAQVKPLIQGPPGERLYALYEPKPVSRQA
jgi:hypothetical protein